MQIVDRDLRSDITSSRDETDSAPMTVCQQCFGTGVEIVPGKGARPCPRCRAENSKQKLLEAAHIPRRYSDCSLENFHIAPDAESRWVALSYAQRLIEDYPDVEKGLLLVGSVGVGKTHLAVAILRELISKGVPCLFYESGSLLKKIQDSYNPISKNSELGVLAPVYEAEVLVLDELGSTILTDWVRDTMYQIINRRYNDKKLTIFTTNRSDEPQVEQDPSPEPVRRNPESLTVDSGDAKKSSRKPKTLEEQIGIPLRSRLFEMCNKVLIEGEDYRKRPKKPHR